MALIWYGVPDMLFPERRKKGKRRYPVSTMVSNYKKRGYFYPTGSVRAWRRLGSPRVKCADFMKG